MFRMTQQTQHEDHSLEELWSDLVIAILSVNNNSLEKTYVYLPGLKAVGLRSPENLSRWGVDEIVQRLQKAGCNRGAFMTPLYAKRLSSLGAAVSATGIEKFTSSLGCGQRSEIASLLLPINGIGPRVLENFFLLRQLQ
jgi:hypothetical protein